MKQALHLTKGAEAEGLAGRHLQHAGLQIVEQNFHSRFGEIDLICSDSKTVVFVEVRYRASHQFGGALASVTPAKQKKIIKTAEYFLQTNKQFKNHYLRFDVIGIDSDNNLEWIKGAFIVSE